VALKWPRAELVKYGMCDRVLFNRGKASVIAMIKRTNERLKLTPNKFTC
jgi:hypothetical protein